MIEPLLGKRNDKHGEERSSQVRVKDGLDADDSKIRATPSSESGIGDVPNRVTGDNHEEVVTQSCVIPVRGCSECPDERGCNCGEQTGLYPQKRQTSAATGLDARKILTRIKVVFKSSSHFLIKTRSYSSASR